MYRKLITEEMMKSILPSKPSEQLAIKTVKRLQGGCLLITDSRFRSSTELVEQLQNH